MKDQNECCRKGFWESAKDTAKRMAKDASLAPEEVRKERMKICGQCEQFENNKCKLCGCVMPMKTTFANMRCPADPPKWTEVTT
jgi:hypothetical protein